MVQWRALTRKERVYELGVYTFLVSSMKTARVFITGNSQVVRLPKEFWIDASRVEILKRGKDTILRPIKTSLEDAFNLLAALPDDFMPDGRKALVTTVAPQFLNK